MKRTALRRRAPMHVRPPRPRPKRRSTPPPETHTLAYDELLTVIYARAGGRCERCGTGLCDGFDGYHRKLRSQGGPDTTANLVAICRGCHDWAHQHPAEARSTGWLVRSVADPGQVALLLHDGRTVLLDQDGGYDVLVWPAA